MEDQLCSQDVKIEVDDVHVRLEHKPEQLSSSTSSYSDTLDSNQALQQIKPEFIVSTVTVKIEYEELSDNLRPDENQQQPRSVHQSPDNDDITIKDEIEELALKDTHNPNLSSESCTLSPPELDQSSRKISASNINFLPTTSFDSNLNIPDTNKHKREKPITCEFCNSRFTKLSKLKRHLNTHTGEKPHVCNICNRAFSQIGHLKLHVRTHTGEKPYNCKQCDRTFSDSSVLKRHERRHAGEKPYSCELCGRAFSTSTDLKRHGMIHTGEKPHTCNICNRGFSHKQNLKTHAKTCRCNMYIIGI